MRGDARGWIDDGTLLPPNPALEAYDKGNLKHDPYHFPRDVRVDAAREMVRQLRARMHLRVFAVCVQAWHAHVVVGGTRIHHYADIAKCAKDAVTHFLKAGRPVWGRDYDKRFCFDRAALASRVRYVEKHNEADGLPARVVEGLDEWR